MYISCSFILPILILSTYVVPRGSQYWVVLICIHLIFMYISITILFIISVYCIYMPNKLCYHLLFIYLFIYHSKIRHLILIPICPWILRGKSLALAFYIISPVSYCISFSQLGLGFLKYTTHISHIYTLDISFVFLLNLQ